MKKMKFLIPAFALVALTFAGCSDDGDDQPVVTKLALADPAQAALTFVATSPEAQVIALDTDASTVTVEQVLAEGEEKAEWCVVTVQSATQIKVAPASNLTTEERTAKYRISAGTVTPVEFTVTQEANVPEQDKLSIPEEYAMGVMGSGDFEQIQIPVTTTAEKWTATLTSMMGDDEAYCTYFGIFPEEGKSGEELTITFYPNTMGEMQSGWVIELTAGNADPVQIYVMQQVPESKDYATSVVVSREGDESSDWEPIPVESPYAVNLAAAGGMALREVFYIKAEGKFDLKIVEPGTMTEIANPETSWLHGTESGANWPISADKNETGAERKLDIIVTGAEGVELFRMKVTQAGA